MSGPHRLQPHTPEGPLAKIPGESLFLIILVGEHLDREKFVLPRQVLHKKSAFLHKLLEAAEDPPQQVQHQQNLQALPPGATPELTAGERVLVESIRQTNTLELPWTRPQDFQRVFQWMESGKLRNDRKNLKTLRIMLKISTYLQVESLHRRVIQNLKHAHFPNFHNVVKRTGNTSRKNNHNYDIMYGLLRVLNEIYKGCSKEFIKDMDMDRWMERRFGGMTERKFIAAFPWIDSLCRELSNEIYSHFILDSGNGSPRSDYSTYLWLYFKLLLSPPELPMASIISVPVFIDHPEYADVLITVGTECNKQTFELHRIILARDCEYLGEEIAAAKSTREDGKVEIRLPQIASPIFNDILHWIYHKTTPSAESEFAHLIDLNLAAYDVGLYELENEVLSLLESYSFFDEENLDDVDPEVCNAYIRDLSRFYSSVDLNGVITGPIRDSLKAICSNLFQDRTVIDIIKILGNYEKLHATMVEDIKGILGGSRVKFNQ
ncbi:hypothetical protein ABW19_dt0207137 [Dactylella cylindrospora]|nr:hypothetical protein ABW19_dt0207137 [Dactylella cylindrospora]